MTRRLLVLAALAAGLLMPQAASATPAMDVGIADDRLLFESPESAASTVAEWRASGVDVVRIFARWGAHAPDVNETAPPAGFDEADHADPRYDWRALDRAIGAVVGADMRVVLTVTGWGPVWGSGQPSRRNPRWKPDPARFGRFARAVATRYAPLVDRYIVWNEPNVALWLQPQSQCSRGRCTPFAPHQYRRLARAAEPAIRDADPGAKVLLGALAPRGSSGRSQNGNLRPLAFLRAFGCVSTRYRRVRTGSCRGFRPATGDLLAYHPHGLKLSPTRRDPQRDQAHLPDLGRLTSAVDRIARAGGIRVRGAKRLPLYLDEYAYQTNPPDRVLGVSRTAQAAYLQQSASMAWSHPRVRGLVWYVWRDEPMAGGSGGWQSGVRLVDGTAKPAFAAFRAPFWASRRDRRTVRMWGQVRPGGQHTVTLERRTRTGWVRLRDVRTDARGGFVVNERAVARGTYRFRSEAATSGSRTVR